MKLNTTVIKKQLTLLLKRLFFLCCLMASIHLSAQTEFQISGVITDDSGEGLPGATIQVKGTTLGTVTSIDGSYTLKCPSNAVVVVSFVGYRSEEISVNNRTEISVSLSPDAEALEEVVVVGYGTQEKMNVTGAVATVDSKKLSIVPAGNVTNNLAGRAPGLITKQESGQPGSDGASLSIRNFGTPLYIVDGIQQPNIGYLAPGEIQSISVLKDASAAVFGARAGNGVVLVTTKRGSEKDVQFNVRSTFSVQTPTLIPKMASSGQMAELYREEHINAGRPESTQRFTQEEVDLFYAGTDPDYPNTDWYDVAVRDYAPMSQHDVSARGGNESIKYFGMVGYTNQETMFKGDAGAFERINFRGNLDVKLTDNLSAQIDVAHIWEDRDFSWRLNNESVNTVWAEYWRTEPFFNPTNPDGSIAYGGSGAAVSLATITDKSKVGYDRNQNQILFGTLGLNYDFGDLVDGLKTKALINVDQRNTRNKLWRYLAPSLTYVHANDSYIEETAAIPPELTQRNSSSRQLTTQLSINYDKRFGYHKVSALALYETIDNFSEYTEAGRVRFSSNEIEYLFFGPVENQFTDGRAFEMGRQSLVFRGNYAFKDKYLLEATLRVDESAKFREDQRTGYFPSLSVGWRLTEEDFIRENIPVLDRLKLRASVSQTGFDDVGNFLFLSGFEAGNLYITGNAATAGLRTTGIANPFLTWEEMTTYNAGLDFAFFEGKLFGEFDVFQRDRDGIPGRRSISLPSTFGADLPTENLNAQTTTGFELSLGYMNSINDFSYTVRGNISKARTKWKSFDEPEFEDPDQARISKRTGQFTNITFGYVSDGLFTSQEEIDNLDYVYDEITENTTLAPGDVRFLDLNGDGLLNFRDQRRIGQGDTPDWIGGLDMDFQYKGFDLSVFFQGGFGFTQRMVLRHGTNFSELNYSERWTEENNNSNALFPRLGGAPSNNWVSDFYFRPADYIRLRVLQIGYSFPSSLLSKAKVDGFRIFASGTNLFTLSETTKYDVDPETRSGQGGNWYPQQQTFTFGANLSF